MVAFETPPTDEELRSFADPGGASPYVRLDDDGTTLTARPKPFPMWFVWVCLLVPAAVAYATLVWAWVHINHPLCHIIVIGIAVFWIPGALVTTRIIIGGVLQAQIRHDDFFTLDREAGTLTLPRAGVVLRRREVVELVEVHATHWVKDSDGCSGEHIRELSVLARGPDGTLTRYPVVASGYAKPVGRVAAGLSEFFGVPRRKLVKPLFLGGWRRAD